MSAKFAETHQVVSGVVPVDLSTAANDGDWVSLKGYGKLIVIMFKAVGTAGDDPTVAFQQATAVAGTGAKDLTKITEVWKKQGTVLTATGTYTKATQTAAASYVDLTSAELAAIYIFEIDAEELDADNDFDCVRARIADVGTNAQLGSILYILADPRYPEATVDSAIAD